MDAALASLQSVLLLLAAAVLAVVVCRSLRLPPIIGYVVTGIALGPHALRLVSDPGGTHRLAEFGVVFLMFSIGLEFSLARLAAMRRLVFGLGGMQVACTMLIGVGIALAYGASWQAGLGLGAIAAMSSTAIVSKLLAERLELDRPHGREAIGVLLFQDIAVIPLLILVPALGQPGGVVGLAIAVALAKAAIVLIGVAVIGPKVMPAWLGLVARRRSSELFVLNILFIALLLSFVTALAGLSLVLGAFIAGMLVSETEYRFQVEQDIRAFRDVLLGLFFVTVGMMLDVRVVAEHWPAVAGLLFLLIVGKMAVAGGLSYAFGRAPGTAIRVGIALAQGGEFGFVLLSLAGDLAPPQVLQSLLAAMILSMLAAPFLIAASDRIAMRISRSEWMLRSLELHRVAVQALEAESHVIILGYGRNGQRLARLLEAEGLRYIALDLDPERVRDAALAGERVVFADSANRGSLAAAGIERAAAVVVTFADVSASLRVLANIHDLNPGVAVIVRAREEADIDPLMAAGASEVVPEAFESGVMLASHTLAWVGVPLSRVMRRMSQVRAQQYRLLRGVFAGESDADDGEGAARLHSVTLEPGASAIGRAVSQLDIDGVQVVSVRRAGVKAKLSPSDAGELRAGDVVVLLGKPERLALAENRLLAG